MSGSDDPNRESASQATEYEQAALAAALASPDVVPRLLQVGLAPRMMPSPRGEMILQAILDLHDDGVVPELSAVMGRLSEKNELVRCGGVSFLSSLLDHLPDVANAEWYAKKLIKLSTHKLWVVAARRFARNPDDDEARTEVESRLTDFNSRGSHLNGVLMSDVTPENVSWAWRNRIPLGKITILDGDPGQGKSAVTVDLAARISVGAPMPDGSRGVKGGVVLVSFEDGLADTIRPRLEAAGADLSRVLALRTIGQGNNERPLILPDDIGVLREAVERVGAVFVVIDPLMAALNGKVDSHRDQDVRRVLTPLAALADDTDVAILVVRHLNKGLAGNPIYRGGGSIGIIGAARSGMIIASDPADENVRVLASTKSNLGPPPRPVAFSLDATATSVRVMWLGYSGHAADTLLAARHSSAKRPIGNRGAVLDLLEGAGESLHYKRIGEDLNLEDDYTRQLLHRMVESEQIERVGRGQYAVASQSSQASIQPFPEQVKHATNGTNGTSLVRSKHRVEDSGRSAENDNLVPEPDVQVVPDVPNDPCFGCSDDGASLADSVEDSEAQGDERMSANGEEVQPLTGQRSTIQSANNHNRDPGERPTLANDLRLGRPGIPKDAITWPLELKHSYQMHRRAGRDPEEASRLALSDYQMSG